MTNNRLAGNTAVIEALRSPVIRRLATLLATSLVIVLLYWTYAPALDGPFVFDDIPNLAHLSADATRSPLENLKALTFGNDSGPTGRPVAMATFAIQILATGLDTRPMKLANLAIHSITAILLFFFARLILAVTTDLQPRARSWTALLIASAWAIHPFNLTSVAYIVQRMNSLAAMFIVAGALAYTSARNRQLAGSSQWSLTLGVIALFGLLAIFAKENGALLPLYLFTIECCLFGFAAIKNRDRRIVIALFVVTLLAPGLAFGIILASDPNIVIGGYHGRDFTLTERLLTESRILVWYIRMLLAPDINQMTLFHDDITVSTSLLAPPSTLISVIGLTGILTAALIARRQAPWLAFGILWFFAGHALESTIIPLELVFEHRNYLPGFGILFAGITAATLLLKRLKPSRSLGATAASLAIFGLAISTHIQAHRWSDNPEAELVDAEHHPGSPRAHIVAAAGYGKIAKSASGEQERGRLFKLAEDHFSRALALMPESPNPLFGWLLLYYDHQRQPPGWITEELQRRLANGFLDTTTINGLDKITLCLISNQCQLADNRYLQLLDSVFDNPRMTNGYAARILGNRAAFYANRYKDYNTAVLLTKKAIELSPDIDTRLELATYLTLGGWLHDGSVQLDTVESQDWAGTRSRQVESVRSIIANGNRASKPNG